MLGNGRKGLDLIELPTGLSVHILHWSFASTANYHSHRHELNQSRNREEFDFEFR
jgi:hypothetical protein